MRWAVPSAHQASSGVAFGLLTGGLGQVPAVSEYLLDVAGDGEPAGDLAPGDLDQGVQLGVVGRRLRRPAS